MQLGCETQGRWGQKAVRGLQESPRCPEGLPWPSSLQGFPKTHPEFCLCSSTACRWHLSILEQRRIHRHPGPGAGPGDRFGRSDPASVASRDSASPSGAAVTQKPCPQPQVTRRGRSYPETLPSTTGDPSGPQLPRNPALNHRRPLGAAGRLPPEGPALPDPHGENLGALLRA